jgi:phosphopantothenoylcysteine decarboxylase/phosphopantothenate--cysteine ligase
MLSDKKILVAVTGSIAAYKTAFFVRLLVKAGAQVKVVMTRSATDFITPLTLSTLSKNPVYLEFYDSKDGSWSNHVELGLWADLMIIAPASANTIAKMAQGICDNLLLATYLSARCPVMIAPAMDLDMLQHHSTQKNLKTLISFGNSIIEPTDGELASGLSGKGRLAEPEELLKELEDYFKKKDKLTGKTVLITSGPTHEAIDPVRFIGNHSSGKMGAALAEVASSMGAKVTFITGPVSTLPFSPNVEIQKVTSANEMLDAVQKHHKQSDIVIFAAAVADYRPAEISEEKRKRSGNQISIDLVENPDIAATLGKQKSPSQLHIGDRLRRRICQTET